MSITETTTDTSAWPDGWSDRASEFAVPSYLQPYYLVDLEADEQARRWVERAQREDQHISYSIAHPITGVMITVEPFRPRGLALHQHALRIRRAEVALRDGQKAQAVERDRLAHVCSCCNLVRADVSVRRVVGVQDDIRLGRVNHRFCDRCSNGLAIEAERRRIERWVDETGRIECGDGLTYSDAVDAYLDRLESPTIKNNVSPERALR